MSGLQPSTIPAFWGKSRTERPGGGATAHRLRFKTADGAVRWVKSLPLNNLAAVSDALLGQLIALSAEEIPPLERARIAEVLRDQVAYVHNDLARRYAGKAQPPEQREGEVAAQAIALWHALWEQYSACLKPLFEGDAELAPVKSKLLQRGLFVGKELVLAYGLARRIPPPTLWEELHAYYQLAEVLGCVGAAVSDPLLPLGVGISCYATYSHALLMALADPYALSVKQIELTDRWLQRWGRKMYPYAEPRESEGPLILIDLRASVPATLPDAPPAETNDSIRYAYAGKLGISVHGRLGRLKNGADPSELQLGHDCGVDQCMTLLSHLEAHWCRPRHSDVAAATASLQLATGGVYAAFFRVGRRSFEREDPNHPYSFRSHAPLAAFDGLTDYDRNKERAEHEWPWESWSGTHTANEATLTRSDVAHYRWTLDQLVVARDSSGEHAGHVTRIASSSDGAIHLAITLWNGKPQTLTLRPLSTAMAEQHPPLPVLSITAGQNETAFLILPSRTFQPGRELRCTDGGSERRFRLVRLIQRGADFERVTFEAIK